MFLVASSGQRIAIGANQLVAEYRLGSPPPPAGNTYVVAQNGTAEGSGSASSPMSIDFALSVAAPADTIQMRGGRWRTETGFNAICQGEDGSPITITRYPGETPVIDGSVAAFIDSPVTAWEVFDAGRSIYRSTATYPTSTGAHYDGFIALGVDPDDHDNWQPLVPYQSYAYLASDSHLWHATDPYYIGPGVFFDTATGRIYVRLVNATSESQCGRTVPQIADPDPRNNALHLGRFGRYAFNVSGHHVRVVDVGVMQGFYGCYVLLDSAAAPNIGFEAHDNEGHVNYFVLRANYGHDWKVLGGLYDGHLDPETHWVSWADVKQGLTAALWIRKDAFDLGSSEVFEIGPSPGTGSTAFFPTPNGAQPIVVRGFFDGILGTGHGTAEDLATVHGIHFDRIFDDAWQQVSQIYRTMMYDFLCTGAGPSRDATGSANPNPMPGTNYIHHGRIIGQPVFWYRKGNAEDPAGTGVRESIALSSHGTIVTYTVPWRMWNVDLEIGVSGAPMAAFYGGFGRFGPLSAIAEATDERYNCLYVSTGQSVGRDAWTYTGEEIYDGNLYWGWVAPQSIWRLLDRSGDVLSNAVPDVATLRSLALADSQVYYAPGWEASGISMDPDLDENFDPQAAIHAGALDLSSTGWPGTEGYVPHRGAKAP